MINLTQLAAQTLDPLSDEQIMILTLLVKNYRGYRNAPALWPNLAGKLMAEVTTPTVKTQALKAILVALGSLPTIVVESRGNEKAHSYFSTEDNWNELAKLTLDTLYEIPVPTGRQSYAVVQRTIDGMIVKDHTKMERIDSLNHQGLIDKIDRGV